MVSRAEPRRSWSGWQPGLADDVELRDRVLHDDVTRTGLLLDEELVQFVSAIDGSRSVAELEESWPDAGPILLGLNQAHLVNFRRPALQWLPSWTRGGKSTGDPPVCQRHSLGTLDLSDSTAGVVRAILSYLRSGPSAALGWMSAAAILAWVSALMTPFVLLAAAACLAGLVLHELGHILAARWLCGRAYAVGSRGGVFIAAPLSTPRSARCFALAGPVLAAGCGALLWSLAGPLSIPGWVAAPLLVHVVYLVPPMDDGVLLWTGRRAFESQVKGDSHDAQ